MKKAILFILIGAALGGGGMWLHQHDDDAKPGAEKSAVESPAAEDSEKASVARDEEGNAVITMSDELQGDAGIVVASPEAAQFAPELKGYGHVLDPSPLAVLMTELATDRAASEASSNELVRLNLLAGQGNASARVLQTAQAAAARDQLAVQSVNERLALGWGKALTEQKDLPGFINSLTAQEKILVRIDLPAGENANALPIGARLVALSGSAVDAEFLGTATAVDPQTQGRGLIFVAKTGAAQLAPGEAVTGYLKLPGEPLAGAIVPRSAIVRTEGKGWVYVLGKTGETFTRKEIILEHTTDTGWFVTNGITAGDHVVVTGAQTLLSLELMPAVSAAPAD